MPNQSISQRTLARQGSGLAIRLCGVIAVEWRGISVAGAWPVSSFLVVGSHFQSRTAAPASLAGFCMRNRLLCQLAAFHVKLPSMEAEIDCKLQSNSN